MTAKSPATEATRDQQPGGSGTDRTGYADAVKHYEFGGWDGALPLPVGQKSPPPDGYTGKDAPDPTSAQQSRWARQHPNGNLALRLPADVFCLDVDAYGDKPGAVTLADLTAKLGPLPGTWRATSRLDDPVSGKYLFRVPVGLHWPGGLPGIDFIHRGHRYVMAWPSIHPNGELCRWFQPDGKLGREDPAEIPWADELPDLPEAWVAYLTGGEAQRAAEARGPVVPVDGLLTPGEPCRAVLKVLTDLDTASTAGGARHDAMLGAVLKLLRLAEQGHRGTAGVYAAVHADFVAAVVPDRTGGEAEAEAEWSRAETGAVAKVTGKPTAEADKRCCGTARGAGLNLPPEFWSALPALGTIRDAAHSRGRSPDAVLGSLLARLSAMCSHKLRFDAGQGTGSLNLFTAVVGKSGTGKSQGVAVARELVDVPSWLSGDSFRDGLPLGSGEGLAEAFMGTVAVATTEVYKSGARKGEPKSELQRRQVRHNVFMYVDEGQTLTATAGRSGATIGPTLRSAAVGELLGQANAREDTTRLIPGGSYSLGLVIGYQPGTAAELLADTDAGTPQRFLWVSSTDPGIPDERVEWPGPLTVNLTGSEQDAEFAPGQEHPREGIVSFDAAIRDELWAANLARNRGTDVDDNELNSHAALMRCKLAALLAVLDGRGEVTTDDWHLASLLWDTSCTVRDSLVTAGREAAQRAHEARDDAAVGRATRTAVAQSQAGAQVDRAARRLAGKVHSKGALTRGAARQELHSDKRYLYREALAQAVEVGWLTEDDEGKVGPGPSQPVAS